MATVKNVSNRPASIELEDASGVLRFVDCAPGAEIEVPDYLVASRGEGCKTLINMLSNGALAPVEKAKAGKPAEQKSIPDAKAVVEGDNVFVAQKKGK